MKQTIDSHQRERGIVRVTLFGSLGNLALLVFKFLAGVLGHSAAMVADAVHSLSDFVTDLIVILFVHLGAKPSDKDHDFGHGKYETLATLCVSIILFGVGLLLAWTGGGKIVHFVQGEELERPGAIALWAALASIVVKEGLYWYTLLAGRRLGSKTVEANAWHHRSDALSSVGTALGIGGAILLGERWTVLDPVAAVVVSLLILRVSWQLFKPCLGELLEASLPDAEEQRILSIVSDYQEVTDPHNLRTRRIGNYAAVAMHLRVDPQMTVADSHAIATKIEERIKALLGEGSIVNIHIEPRK